MRETRTCNAPNHSASTEQADMTSLENQDIAASRVSDELRFHQAPHISAAWCSDELVLLDASTGRYFTLNHVGGRIWELLATSRSANDLAQCLRTEYDFRAAMHGSTLRRDIVHMLDNMLDAGLLVAENPALTAEPSMSK